MAGSWYIGVHLSDSEGDTSEFDFGLDLILDGLARSLKTKRWS